MPKTTDGHLYTITSTERTLSKWYLQSDLVLRNNKILIENFDNFLTAYLQNEDPYLLKIAVSATVESFPVLSLWKAFSVRNTAENRRDAAILYICNMLQHYVQDHKVEGELYHRLSLGIAIAMQNAQLTAEVRYPAIERQTAKACAGLLRRNPQFAEHLTIQNVRIHSDPTSGNCWLTGLITFGTPDANMPVFLRDVQLLFNAEKKILIDTIDEMPLIDILPLLTRQDAVFDTLFSALPPENQLILKISCWNTLFPHVSQFCIGDKLGTWGVVSYPETLQLCHIYSWEDMNNKLNDFKQRTDIDETLICLMPDCLHQHHVAGVNTAALLFADMSRGLNRLEIIINGNKITSETKARMISDAETMQLSDLPVFTRAVKAGELWTQSLQAELKTDKSCATQITAALIYSLWQGGAGKGYMSLSRIGPPCKLLQKEPPLKVLSVDTNARGALGISMLEVGQVNWNSADFIHQGVDFRGGVVAFHLPELRAESALEMAVNYTRTDIVTSGGGVRYVDK